MFDALYKVSEILGRARTTAEQLFEPPPAARHSPDSRTRDPRSQLNDAAAPPASATRRERTGVSRDICPTMSPSLEHRRDRSVRRSDDERAFVPDYSNPPDAVPIGMPNTVSRSNKPGGGSFAPRNTLDAPSRHAAAGFGPPRPAKPHTSRPTTFGSLSLGSTRGDNVSRRSNESLFPDSEHLRKKQKVSHHKSSHGVVDLTDDDDKPRHSPPSVKSSSAREHFIQFTGPASSKSGHSRPSGGVSGAFPINEYQTVEDRMNPKVYSSSQNSQNGVGQNRSRSASAPRKVMQNTIELSDDEPAQPRAPKSRPTAFNDLLANLDDGPGMPVLPDRSVGSATASDMNRASGREKEHSVGFDGSSSLSHHDPRDINEGRIGAKNGKAHNLGDFSPRKFVKAEVGRRTDFSARGKAQLDEESEDELQVVERQAPSKHPKSVRSANAPEDGTRNTERSPYFPLDCGDSERSVQNRGHVPGSRLEASRSDIKPSTFTSGKAPKPSQRRSGNVTNVDRPKRWPLKLFRIPGCPTIDEPHLQLVRNADGKRYDVHVDGGPVPIGRDIASIEPGKVNRIFHGTLDSLKVRLDGARDDHTVYERFMEFSNPGDRDGFLESMPGTIRRRGRNADDMEKLFSRSEQQSVPAHKAVSEQHSVPAYESVDDADELALIQSRVDHECQEAAERKPDSEQTSVTRPRSKLRSQMQADNNRAEPDTRTSRAMISSERKDMTSSMALASKRNTRSHNRIDSPDVEVTYDKDSSPEVQGEWPAIRWPQEWSHPLVYPPTGRQRAQVDYSDLFKLEDGEFLNDSIITFYMTWAAKQAEESGRLPPNKVYWFSTHFYTVLTSTQRGQKSVNYANVQRWTSKVDLFAYDYVVVPINEDAHWYLAIICNLPHMGRKLDQEEDATVNISKDSRKELHKDSLAAKVFATLGPGKPIVQAENTKDVEDSGDPMEIDEPAPPEAVDEKELPEEKGARVQDDRLTTPQPGNSGARNSPIAVDDPEEKDGAKSQANGPDEILKTSPGAKKGRKGKPPGQRKYGLNQPVIIMLDSLGLSHAKTTRNLKEYLVEEAKSKKGLELDTKDLQGMTAKNIPLQDNYCDCGVFLCSYFQKFVDDPEQFVHKILRREMDSVRDWPDMNPRKLRRDIVELLDHLEKEQRQERKEQRKKRQEEKRKMQQQGSSSASKQSSPEKASALEQEPQPQPQPQPQPENAISKDLVEESSPEHPANPSPPSPRPASARRSPEVVIESPQSKRAPPARKSPEVAVRSPRATQSPRAVKSPPTIQSQSTSRMVERLQNSIPREQRPQRELHVPEQKNAPIDDDDPMDYEIPDSQPDEDSQNERNCMPEALSNHNNWYSELDDDSAANDHSNEHQGESRQTSSRQQSNGQTAAAVEVILLDESQS